jgi:hypothetical protein
MPNKKIPNILAVTYNPALSMNLSFKKATNLKK